MAAFVPPNLGLQCQAMGVTPRPQSSAKPQGTPRPHSTPKAQGTLKPHSSPTPQGTPHSPEVGDHGRDSGRNSSQSESTTSVGSVPNEALSGVQVDQAIAHAVRERHGVLRSAFRALDTEGNFTVTKGEFRQVIQGFILPLTQPQFTALLAKAPRRENGSVAYMEFLRRYCRTPTARSRFPPRSRQQAMTLKELQHCLRDKIGNNLKNVTRAFRLFDHNRDGRIQKHELLRVLESYCLPLGNQEFYRLWSHYSPDNPGTMSYRDFLQRLSIDCENNAKLESEDSVKSALNWAAVSRDNVRQLQERTPADSATLPCQGLTLEQVHDAFLNKMRLSYNDVWRALQVSDVTCSGVVSLEDLRSIITHFLFPLSDFLFHGLASRFGLKAAEPVPWTQFMAQFKDLAPDERQTSRVSRGHSEQQGPDIAQQNLQALQEVYPLLKSSALKSDQGRAGKVMRAELRRLLEGHKFRLTELQFKELMILLDPAHTGVIDSQRILELLHPPPDSMVEARECSGPTQKDKLTMEADGWSTVEGLLRDKLSEHLDQVTEALRHYDQGQNGTVHQDELREVINRYGLPLSEDHFNRLCEPHTDSGRLAYDRFLNSLGVSKRRSTARAHRVISRSSACRVRTRAVENTVLRKMRENLAQRNITVHDCLPETGGNSDGTLSLKHFERMLEDCGISLDQDEFDVLTEALGFKDGTLSHADFLVKYEDKLKEKRATELNNSVTEKQPRFLTAEDCLSQMKERIEKYHGDVLTAFLLIDRNRDSVIDRNDLRRLFDTLLFLTKEQEYQRMLDLLGLKPGATLNYTEFYSTIQACSQPGALPRPTTRLKRFVEEAGEQVHSHLVARARSSWSDMAKAFFHSDEEGNGLVSKNELRELLYSYSLPITANQFEKIWSRYDREGRGVLTQSEFLDKLGVAPESCGRGQSRQTEEGRSDSRALGTAGSATPGPLPESHPEPLPQRESVEHFSPDKAMQRVREEVTTSYYTLLKAFSALDRSGNGTVSSLEFRRVLDHFCVRLSDRQHTHLLASLPVSEEDHSVPWRTFLERFHLNNQVKTSDNQPEKAEGSVKPRPLPLSDILERIREVVCARIYTIAKEMADRDYAHLNVISKENFRIICDRHFLRLTSEQFEGLWKQLPVNDFGNLEYNEFLKKFSGDPAGGLQNSERRDPRPSSGVPTTTIRRPKTAPCTLGRIKSADVEEPRGAVSVQGSSATPLRTFDALDRTVRGQIRGCWRELQRRCQDEDMAGCGGISTDRFLAILQDLSVRMTRSELEQLALKYGIAVNGRIPYVDFLRQLLLSLQPRPATAFHRPKVPLPRTLVSRGVLTGPCADTMLGMLGLVRKFRRPMRHSFVACDPTRNGQISISDFRQVLGQYGICLSQDEVFHLTSYFDKNLSGKISYNDFLLSFLQ